MIENLLGNTNFEYIHRCETVSGTIERYKWKADDVCRGWNDLRNSYPQNVVLVCRAALSHGYTVLLVPPNSVEETRENGLYPIMNMVLL